jgi:murein DD-endopeptidase MepM/ murein hydrolase activator NlpD
VIAGGTLAAAGQAALTEALPAAADGANVLRMSVARMAGADGPGSLGAASTPAAPPVDPAPAVARTVEPRVADVGDLVKAADLQRRAAPAAPADADPAPAASADADPAPGGVRMVAGRVTSGFGPRWGTRHQGLDIAAPVGTPINAPLAGEVIASGPARGFGMWVRVRHDDGTVTTYGHVNRSLVRVGETVEAGEKIAEVGNRGHSTGPHLHVEVQTPGGRKINPRPWLDRHGIAY